MSHIPQNRAVDALLRRLEAPPGRDPERDIIYTARALHDVLGDQQALLVKLGLGTRTGPERIRDWLYAGRLLNEVPTYIRLALDVLAQSRQAYILNKPDGS